MPSFKKGLIKGTETPWTRRKVTAGRLICDTYFAAKVQHCSFPLLKFTEIPDQITIIHNN
jgi:hypothetical protein